jgi:DNA invertase Pin-like site-specific DNA recombinase
LTKAFAYARVSTGEQAKGFSLGAQFDEIERYCSESGFELVDRFSDSMSGSKLKERQGLMSMLHSCIPSEHVGPL